MADDTTQTAAPPQDDAIAQALRLAQILQGQQQQPTAPQPQERSFASLLGSALGSGSTAPTVDEEDAGRRALMSFGINMLQAGGPSLVKRSFGQALAQGLSGAGESEMQSQQLAAARLGAQQDYQQKQQEMRLAAIKEAIPLLTLQQQRKMMGLPAIPSSIGGGGGTPSIGAVTGNPPTIARGDTSTPAGWVANNPGNLMYAGQPDASGTLPLSGGRTLAAFPDMASGVAANANQILTNQDQHGINTVRGMVTRWVSDPKADLTSYVADTAKALGVDPDKPIDFHDPGVLQKFILAQQPHETGGKGISLNPADVTAGVTRALTPRAAPGGGGTATAATPPPATPTPPAASTAPVRTTPPPGVIQTDQPAGGATVAGPPGTAIVGAAKPAGPAVGGDVNAMLRGMIGAGANATTLAPGAATSGPVAPPAVVAAATPQGATPPAATTTPPATPIPQVTPQAAQPSGPPAFQYVQHDPPPGILPRGSLTADEQSVVADARRSYATAIQASDRLQMVDPAKAAELRSQAEATLQGTLDKELSARTGRTKEAGDALKEWYTNDYNTQKDANKLAVESYYRNQDAQTKQANDLQLEQVRADQTRLTNKEQVFNAANQEGLKTAQKEQADARDVSANLIGFQAISDGVGQPGWLQTAKLPGSDHTIAEQLQQAGITLSDTAGVQLLKGGINNLVKTLRQGMAMGSLSDRDLNFIERMGPTEWMDQDTRTAAVSYLRQAYQAKMRFSSDVQKEMSRGKNYGDAMDAADAKQKPFVPAVPQDLSAHWTDNSPEWSQRRIQWAQENDVRPGTLYHMSNGAVMVMKSPATKQPGQR